jgi:MFS family permease
MFGLGMAAFTLASLACGLAPTVVGLVAARAVQGGAAAMLVPQVLSIIQAGTSGERRSRAIGYYGAGAGIAMVVGQLLGGVLVAGLGWRPIFLLNVPVGVVALVLAGRTIPETRASNPLGVDRLGTALLGVALLALLVPLMEGRQAGWPAWCWALLGLSPVAAVAFVVVERRLEARGMVPLLPMSVLRVPSVWRGLSMLVPFFAGFGAFLFAFAITLQQGLRLTALEAGMALAPLAAAFLVMSLVSARLVARYGHRVIAVGACVQVVGLVLLVGTALARWPELGVLAIAPGMAICGAGQGVTAPTIFRVILSGVPAESAGAGSGVMTTTQQASFAVGVATLGSLFVGLIAPLGMAGALAVTVGVQGLLVLGIAVAALRLPR